MLEAVIFDMDGVIVDSEDSFLRSKQQLLRELGVEVDIRFHYDFFGTTSEYTWQTLRDTFRLAEPVPQLIQRADAIRREIIEREGQRPIPGVLNLIRKLHDYPLKLAVASSSPLSDILETLEAFQIRSCFQALVSATTCARSKPFPDVFLKAAEQLSVSPAACLVIEDSRNGLLAAKAAGMACLAYANPHYARQDLKEADRVIDDFAALAVEDLKNLVQPA
jgi:HAD superfamily hydrolase (TIGR01509 family)